MKKDILYLEDRNRFYQIIELDDTHLKAVRIRKDIRIRADFLMHQLANAATRHYLIVTRAETTQLTFRRSKHFTSKYNVHHWKFRNNKVTAKITSIHIPVDTTSGYSSVVMPIVRRIFPKIIAKDLFSVTELSEGTSAVYNLKIKFKDDI